MEDQSDWQPFNEQDPSTHPEVNSLVEYEYSNGKRYTGQYGGFGCFNATGRLNEMRAPIPEDTIMLEKRWRYVKK